MKKQTKTTRSRRNNTKPTKVTKGLLAYHIAASLVSIAPHPHTGRSVHRRHTSHGVLIIALILTGVLLFSNLGTLRAYGITSGTNRTISVSIGGAPPSVGADITFPTTRTRTESPQLQVSGTCEPTTLVATYRNSAFAGSSMCESDGSYATIVQLKNGINVLRSQNYDGLNQPGPTTSYVFIVYQPVAETVARAAEVPPTATAPADILPAASTTTFPTPPKEPIESCYNTPKNSDATSATPTISSSCITKDIETNEKVSVPIRVSGGQMPYALSISWGDNLIDLETVADDAYYTYEHTYKTPGIHNVSMKTTDSDGTSSFLQTVVQVNGEAQTAGPTTFFGTIATGLSSVWTQAPVPLYWAAVTLVLGFWVGDIFQRLFSKGAPKRMPARQRRAH